MKPTDDIYGTDPMLLELAKHLPDPNDPNTPYTWITRKPIKPATRFDKVDCMEDATVETVRFQKARIIDRTFSDLNPNITWAWRGPDGKAYCKTYDL